MLQFLILEKWVSGEAADQGLKVSAKEQTAAFEKAKKDTFPKEADFQKFLKQSGMTVEDAKFQVAFNTVYDKLREKAIKGAEKVTDKDIAAFYDKNKKRFAQPETRDLRVVLTKTKAKADAARKALENGDSWSKVAKKYSIDQASKGNGGSLLGVAKGSQEKAFDDAIFARRRRASSPARSRTQFGYYVFQVQKIVAAKQQTLKEATPAIKQELDGAEPEEGRRQVQQGPPREVEGQDELSRRLRHGPVQERAEAEDRDDRARRRRPAAAARPDAAAAAGG